MLNNPAVPLSYTAKKTDASGRFQLTQGIPGTYRVVLKGKSFTFPLLEGQPKHVDIELTKLKSDDESDAMTDAPVENATDLAAAAPTSQPSP